MGDHCGRLAGDVLGDAHDGAVPFWPREAQARQGDDHHCSGSPRALLFAVEEHKGCYGRNRNKRKRPGGVHLEQRHNVLGKGLGAVHDRIEDDEVGGHERNECE